MSHRYRLEVKASSSLLSAAAEDDLIAISEQAWRGMTWQYLYGSWFGEGAGSCAGARTIERVIYDLNLAFWAFHQERPSPGLALDIQSYDLEQEGAKDAHLSIEPSRYEI
jgi:hypothetical protein